MRRDGVTAWGVRTVDVVSGRPPLLVPVASLFVTYVMVSRPQFGVLVAGVLVLGLLAVCGPATGVLFLVPLGLLGAVRTGGPIPALGGIAAVTVAVVLTVVSAGATGPRTLRAPHGWTALLVLLLLLSFFFPATAAAPSEIPDLLGLLAGLVLLAAVTAVPPSPGGVARVTAIAGSLAGAYALAAGDYADGRLEALGLNPNYLGAMLALPLVAAVGLTRRTRRPGWLALAAICLAAIVATQSRGAFLASVAGVAVTLVQGRPPRSKVLIAAVMAVAGATLPGLAGAVERFAVGARPAEELSSNTAAREHAARFAADVAAAHPLRGIGYGEFPAYAAKSPVFGLYIATHDDYLRLAAEAGALTLAVFLVLLGLGVRGRRTGDLAVLRAVVVAYAVGLVFANQLANLVVSMPFWLSLGCLLAVPPGPRSRRTGSSRGEQRDDR
jgi:O-antigen ligase